MNKSEIIADLESLQEHCSNMAGNDHLINVWNQDIEALGFAIQAVEKLDKIKTVMKSNMYHTDTERLNEVRYIIDGNDK